MGNRAEQAGVSQQRTGRGVSRMSTSERVASMTPMTERLMARLWTTMGEMFPGRWGSQMGDVGGHAYLTWAHGLADLRPGQIKRGLERCLREGGDWPPSLPQFRKWCRASPEDLGLPPEYVAFREAAEHIGNQDHVWSHAAVYVAAREVGSYNLKTMPMTQSSRLFGQCYAVACRRVADGDDLAAEIPRALPSPDDVPGARTVDGARRGLDALRRVMRGERGDEC